MSLYRLEYAFGRNRITNDNGKLGIHISLDLQLFSRFNKNGGVHLRNVDDDEYVERFANRIIEFLNNLDVDEACYAAQKTKAIEPIDEKEEEEIKALQKLKAKAD